MSASPPIPAASASPKATIAWDQTGVLYTAMTALGTLSLVLLATQDYSQQKPALSRILLESSLHSSLFGAALGIAQWIALRRLVYRSLRQITSAASPPPDERRWTRDTAWWIVMTVAGSVVGGTFNVLLLWDHLASIQNAFACHLFIAFVYMPSWAIIAVSQWILLRRCVAGTIGWLVWTLAAGVFAMSLFTYLSWKLLDVAVGIIMDDRQIMGLVIIGQNTPTWLILGAVQARCLKRFHSVWFNTLWREHQPG
jgi:hypothetical protein